MFLANLLTAVGIVVEAAVISVLVWRRTYKSLPIFFSYIAWSLAGDSTMLVLRALFCSHSLAPFEFETYVDSLFQYLVLIELAWAVLRPIQRSMPKGLLLGISLIIAASAVLAWPLSAIKDTPGIPWHLLVVFHAQRTFAILRILFFLVLACSSQFLRIGWRDRELQVATGLGFYSLVSLAGTVVHSHQSYGMPYYYVEVAIGCSYLLSLVYWVYCFAQQEATRRAMTPEMQSLLLGMADVLRQHRARLSEPTITS